MIQKAWWEIRALGKVFVELSEILWNMEMWYKEECHENIYENVNSGFSVVTVGRVALIFSLGLTVVKNFM